MSSGTPESVKNPASEVSTDEPNQKKVRISETVTAKEGNSECQLKEVTKDTDQNDNIEQNNKQGPNKSNTNDTPVDNKQDEDSDKFGELPFDMDPKVAKALDGVESIQAELFKLNEEASEEILKVEQKFNQLRRPLLEKRNESLKDIPNFWVTTLANHHVIAPMLESDQDEGCLHYLTSLDVEEYEDIKSGYKIKFQFAENPYITNEVIIKSFKIITSDDMRSSSTPIEYKNTQQGKALKQVVEASAANFRFQAAGNTQSSFFAWISEQCESGGTDEVAEILKDQIWPNPLDFFFASGEDEYGATDDDSDDDDEDGLEEEVDDNEDDGAFMSEEIGEELPSEEEDNSLDEDDEDEDEEDGEDYSEEGQE